VESVSRGDAQVDSATAPYREGTDVQKLIDFLVLIMSYLARASRVVSRVVSSLQHFQSSRRRQDDEPH